MAAASICALSSCTDATSAHVRGTVPDFVFVSNQTGADRLYIYSNGVASQFPGTADGDKDPQSANGRIIFSGYRASESNSEIYSAKLDGSDLQRLTNNGALDVQPSLSPDASSILFVRFQNGVSRLWEMRGDGSDPGELSTGSDPHTPESMPRISPDGRTILFNSSRTGTSQLWKMPVAGGAAVQLTHEMNGAFDGSWGMDGSTIFFVAGLDYHTIHEMNVLGGTETSYAVGAGNVSEPECGADFCLAVASADHSNGDIVAFLGESDPTPLSLLNSFASEREPAILHR